MNKFESWAPTPTFLYRNYLYEKIVRSINKKSRYLLIGVGTGYFLNRLEQLGFSGKAIDTLKSHTDRSLVIKIKQMPGFSNPEEVVSAFNDLKSEKVQKHNKKVDQRKAKDVM